MVAQVFIERMRREKASPYAWIIDIDHTEKPTDEHNRMGTTGPSWASDVTLTCLAQDLGYGRQFRMLDSDGVLYYSGRLMDELSRFDVPRVTLDAYRERQIDEAFLDRLRVGLAAARALRH